MATNDIILQELNELNSPLAQLASFEVYTVPVGYFEGLADAVLNKIKAQEAATAAEELACLSPFLSKLSKTVPYTIPAGYFESLQENIKYATTADDTVEATGELEALSPLLSGLKKEMPFSVPAGYFDGISTDRKEPAKVVAIGSNKLVSNQPGSFFHRKWFRYAAAAVVAGIITTSAFLFLNREKIDPTTDSHRWVENKVKKVSTEKLDEFVQLADEENLGSQSASTVKVDVKELMKDVPESEIQSLLNDTKILDDNSGTETNTATEDVFSTN